MPRRPPHPPIATGTPDHPRLTRRRALQAGAIGLLGLGAGDLRALRAADVADRPGRGPNAGAVIFIFLSGGLGQLDSFDLKPEAPEEIRGEFRPIATAVPGTSICEHLPMLASRADRWSLVRSLTHPWNEHSQGHMSILSGRTALPPGFDAEQAEADRLALDRRGRRGDLTAARGNLPPAVVLPERLVHNTGRVIPGQFAGLMGPAPRPLVHRGVALRPRQLRRLSRVRLRPPGAGPGPPGRRPSAPRASRCPRGSTAAGSATAWPCSTTSTASGGSLDAAADLGAFDEHRAAALAMLTDPKVRGAFDVTTAPPEVLDRYGDNLFGWSLLMARNLVDGGGQPRPGEPRQQRDLGHPWQRLPAPEGQALPADRPRRLGPARRPGRRGAARLDPGRHGRRVRPDAEDLSGSSPTTCPAATTGAGRSRS